MALQLKNISFEYSNGKVIQNLSFNFEQGGIYVLKGPNGCGKTTLLNLIGSYLRPKSGSIFFDKLCISTKPAWQVSRAGLGRTFQEPRIISNLSVMENLFLATGDNNIIGLREVLCEYNLSELENTAAGNLSYGQQKLLNLVCCIARSPKVILLDEPACGLETKFKEQTAAIVRAQAAANRTILLVEHDADFVESTGATILYAGGAPLEELVDWSHE